MKHIKKGRQEVALTFKPEELQVMWHLSYVVTQHAEIFMLSQLG